MYTFRFKLFLLSILLLICASCYVTNNQTILKKKDGSDIVLFNVAGQKIYLTAHMREKNQVLGSKSLSNDTSDYIKIQVQTTKFDSLYIKKFWINVNYDDNGNFVRINRGQILFDPQLINFSDHIGINNEIVNYTLNPTDIYSVNTILIIETHSFNKLINSNKFLIETSMDFKINGKAYSVQKTDTLFKMFLKRNSFRSH